MIIYEVVEWWGGLYESRTHFKLYSAAKEYIKTSDADHIETNIKEVH